MRNIPQKESLTVEFKGDIKEKLSDNELVESVVGLANAKGGQLFIGVEDNGEITGLDEAHKDHTKLAAMIANKTVPPQPVRVDKIDSGKGCVVVEVPMSTTIVATSSGKVLRRRLKLDGTPETVPLYPHEYNTRLSNLSLLDFSAQTVSDASLADLDPLERERLRNVIKQNRGEQNLLELNDEDLDKSLQFIKYAGDRYVPTYTGLLLIGKIESIKKHIPTTSLFFQVLKNSTVKLNEKIVAPLLATFEKVSDLFTAYNEEQEIESGLFRISVPDFDKRAFREGLVNAFSHRDYSVMQAIRIQIDNDGLAISSPGGFIEGIGVDNLLTTEPRSRNSVLSDALKRIGLAERTGRGIDRILEGSLIYGKALPVFTASDATNVKVILPKSNPDVLFTQFIANETKKDKDAFSVFSLLVLDCLRRVSRASALIIRQETGLEEYRVQAAVTRLFEQGYVTVASINRSEIYSLSAVVLKDLKLKADKSKKIDIEQVMAFAKEKGTITRGDVMSLLNVSAPQAYRVLKSLADNGRLEFNGGKKAAEYRFIK
jgi:ATP-dependent DNA helicase RecG